MREAVETDGVGYLRDGAVAAFEQFGGPFQPHRLNELFRLDARFVPKATQQLIVTQRQFTGQLFDGETGIVEVGVDAGPDALLEG